MASNWREQGGNRRLVYGVVLVVTLVGAVVRVSYLDAPMRWDEARLAGWVESWRYARVVSDYNHVGNHILHTLVVAATHALFGAAPWSVRLPSLLAGIALIPATFLTASTLFSRWIALLAAGLVAGSPYLTFYSINARGYSLQCLLVVILPGLLVRLVEAPARWSTVVAGMVGALALYALPTAVFVLPGLSGNRIVGSLGSGFAGVPGRDSDNGSRTTCHRWSYLHLPRSSGPDSKPSRQTATPQHSQPPRLGKDSADKSSTRLLVGPGICRSASECFLVR